MDYDKRLLARFCAPLDMDAVINRLAIEWAARAWFGIGSRDTVPDYTPADLAGIVAIHTGRACPVKRGR